MNKLIASFISALMAFSGVGCMPHVDSNNPGQPVVVNTGDQFIIKGDGDGDKWYDFSQEIQACTIASAGSPSKFLECINKANKAVKEAGLMVGDCDDNPLTGANVNPGADEVCDGKDNDCDTLVDEGCTNASCDDADACTTDTFVVGTGCTHAPLNCDDGNVCTTDSCALATGCAHQNNTLPCDDANACTTSDTCAAGTCAGAALNCNDSNPCTTDSCGATGCAYVPVTDGSCCFGSTGAFGDAFCAPSTPINLPNGYIWGCQNGTDAAHTGVCTSCKEADQDGFCAIGEACQNNWDDDADGLVDCDDADCAENPTCDPPCLNNAECDDSDPSTTDTCVLATGLCSNTAQPCTPNCAGKTCGADGCGGSCGTCGAGSTCSSGQCVLTPQPEGTTVANCSDNVDNDGDGLVDCQDPGCSLAEICVATGDECTADADCANGKECFLGQCFTVSGVCKPFAAKMLLAGKKLEWYDASGKMMPGTSVNGYNISPTGACSLVVPETPTCAQCTCVTSWGEFPFSSHTIAGSNAQCVWNQM